MDNQHCNIESIKKYIKDANIIFEIGANDGRDLKTISRLWENSVIHCFEPDVESFRILESYKDYNIICNNIGLGSKIGNIPFYKVEDTENNKEDDFFKTAQSAYCINSSYGRYGNSGRFDIKQTVIEITTLNHYCETKNVIPDILLIDTQGSEYDILKGSDVILKDSNIKGVMVEWSEEELYINQPMFKDVENLLVDFNFKLEEKISLWDNIHGDAIFIKQ